MYRLFANIEYKNGDFERRVLNDFIHQRDGEDILKLHKAHWDTNKDQYEKVNGLAFELEAWTVESEYPEIAKNMYC